MSYDCAYLTEQSSSFEASWGETYFFSPHLTLSLSFTIKCCFVSSANCQSRSRHIVANRMSGEEGWVWFCCLELGWTNMTVKGSWTSRPSASNCCNCFIRPIPIWPSLRSWWPSPSPGMCGNHIHGYSGPRIGRALRNWKSPFLYLIHILFSEKPTAKTP